MPKIIVTPTLLRLVAWPGRRVGLPERGVALHPRELKDWTDIARLW